MTSVAICAVPLYQSIRPHDSSSMDTYDTAPISVWDHNHYDSMDDLDAFSKERNLLIAQVGQSRPFAEITSRPNRAYARRWGWDYLMHTGEDGACGTVRVMNHIMSCQDQEVKEESLLRAPYDAILFMSPDAVIMNLDYQFLALLPGDKLVAAGETKADVFVWNLNHPHSLEVARLWLDLGDDSMCDTESLWSAIEMTMEDKIFELPKYVQSLQLSDTGLVEPRLIKFLPGDYDQSFPETMGLLENVADSVCYRYYPRCEVL